MNELFIPKETMSSLLIAEVTGKAHNDVLKSIRKMEPAWVKIGQGNFSLTSYLDSNKHSHPMYELTKEQCLYVATKFNDEARAKLVIRWKQLEEANLKKAQVPMSPAQLILQQAQMLVDIEARQKEQEQKTILIESKLNQLEEEKKAIQKELFETPLSQEKIPELTQKDTVRKLVNDYARLTSIRQEEIYRTIYGQLYYQYHININGYAKIGKESKLDVAERNGFLSKIYAIISAMVYNIKKEEKQ